MEEATEQQNSPWLKSVELRLLRCTLSPSSSFFSVTPATSSATPSALRSLVESLLLSIEQGNYSLALTSSPAIHSLFAFLNTFEFHDSAKSAAEFYDNVDRSVELFLKDNSESAWLGVLGSTEQGQEDVDVEVRFALVICLGAAAILAFVQQNLTGPVVKDMLPVPLLVKELGKNLGEWDLWARNWLSSSVGSDLMGKLSCIQYIVYGNILLNNTRDMLKVGRNCSLVSIASITWWLCRLTLLHQRILEELSSSLYDLLQNFKSETLAQFGELGMVVDYFGSLVSKEEASAIVALVQLEAGIIEYKYGRVDYSRLHLTSAEVVCGLNLSVRGALGFRTINQVDAKAQRVLVTNADQEPGTRISGVSEVQNASAASDVESALHCNGSYDSCDVLMRPRLTENGNSIEIVQHSLLPTSQQAVILAQCLLLKRSGREDELSKWDMAPYIEAIDDRNQTCYAIRRFCEILRIQWESTRSRTKERALLMMDKLVEVVYEASPGAAERIQYSFGVYFPIIPALRKEYGELLVSCGMCAEAVKIFEDLELWDNLILCYRLLGKKAASVDLIKARLSETPNDPRLWCSLGDVTNDDTYYKKALEVSNNKSARAKRSLARSAYNRGHYKTSKELWESAMAQNSLYPDGWFALGAAALKDRDIDKAIDGFTRAVQLDPDNGEAWNNIACLHMMMKKSKPAFIAFKEALKFRRDSWQLWENYSHVSYDIGNYSQSLEATKMVLDLSNNKRVDINLLDKIMGKIEDGSTSHDLPSHANSGYNDSDLVNDINDSSNDSPNGFKYPIEDSREIELLVEMIGSVLQQVIRGGGNESIWGLYARWHRIKGNLSMCVEALIKQIRALQGLELWKDRERFRKFSHATLELCRICMEIASSTGSRKELTMAEMHLRNSVKQAVNFTDTDEFMELQHCLDEVQKQINLEP